MIGIVLWRDIAVGKAVIWCEDQGDLAFYTHPGTFDTFEICVGDWVLFDLELNGGLRLALDVRVLPEPSCPGLVDDIVGAAGMPPTKFSPQLVAASHDNEEVSPGKGEAGQRAGESASCITQTEAVRAKVKERLTNSETRMASAVDGAGKNVILFPRGQSGSRRSA
jgi:hypothetical protein